MMRTLGVEGVAKERTFSTPKAFSLSMRLRHFLSNRTLRGLLSGMLWSLNWEAME
jgi:hypothetical protein